MADRYLSGMEETQKTPEIAALPAEAPVRTCGNCGAQLLGEHCYACGQPVKGLVRHFSSILGDFFDSVFNLDARTLRTLGPLLVKPGYLSLEYFKGHRVRYVSPVRLFFFLCIASIFAVTLALDFDPSVRDSSGNAIAQAQTVADVEHLRDKAVREFETALAEVPDAPGARVGLEIGIQAVKEEAAERIAWIRARDQAIREDKPIPAWEGGDGSGLQVQVEDDADDARASNGSRPPDRARRSVNVGRMQFNDKPWDAKTNPVTVDWLPDQGNTWLNVLIGRANENAKAIEKKPRLLFDAFFGGLPQTLLVLLPVFALLLKIMYVFKRRLYMEHLIVALHSHAFLCAALLVMLLVYKIREAVPAGFVHGALGFAEAAIWIWMPLYLLIMQKRVYRQGWIMTLLKYFILGVFYVVLLSVGAAVTLAVAMVAM